MYGPCQFLRSSTQHSLRLSPPQPTISLPPPRPYLQYESASAVIVVYDVTNTESLQSSNKWLTGVRAQRPSGPPLIGCMVGNKSDLRGDTLGRSEVPRDEASRVAADLGLAYFESSASGNVDVEAPFVHIATEFYKR